MKITTPRRLLATAVLALTAMAGGAVPGQAETAPAQRAAAALPAGYQVLRGGPATVDNFTRLTLACPAGKVIVGGGADIQSPGGGVLLGSFPSNVGGVYQWNVVARQEKQAQVTTYGYAVCVDSAALPGYQIVRVPAAEVANGASRQATCPAGKVVVGGGAEAQGASAALRFSTSPRPKGTDYLWTASGRSLAGTTVGLAVDAICANPIPGYEIVESAATETPNLTRRGQACPTGKTALSGGAGGYNTAILTSMLPELIDAASGYRWAAAVREPARAGAISSVTAICTNLT
ncbi:hypothetical protein ABZY81_29825 [Streptomyces sp. NPDC006514]|uniref:hypothetical protein n=1 Tax=Streptomyces sp. NPDC006514 TaxID=3154308 RepID=UPI0033A34EC2